VVSSFFFILLLLFSLPNLSRQTLDVYHTSTHDVALVQIQNAGMKCTARSSLKIQDAKNCQKVRHLGTMHHHTTLSGYILSTEAYIDNRKKLLSSNISSRRPNSMVNFGPLAAEIGPVVWGTPANFNGLRVLAALLHAT